MARTRRNHVIIQSPAPNPNNGIRRKETMNPGKPGGHPLPEQLIDTETLLKAYFEQTPDPSVPAHQVSFGTSGHRGSSLDTTFNEPHIHAITQAIVEYRAQRGIDGPVLVGKDTHALSRPAEQSAIEVLAADASRSWACRHWNSAD